MDGLLELLTEEQHEAMQRVRSFLEDRQRLEQETVQPPAERGPAFLAPAALA